MGIFSSFKKEEKPILVFDIGSSSVGGALFFPKKSGVPKIILSVREPILLELELNPEKLLRSVMKALDIVASRVCTSGLGVPEKIFCVLSSAWHASQVRTIKFGKNTPFAFTAKLAEELIEKEMRLLNNEHSLNCFEFKNMKTLLNGYPAPKPLGQRARELEMIIYVAMGDGSVMESIEEVVSKHFHRKNIKYSSFTLASFTTIRDLFAKHHDFILVDVGGEMTDISMAKGEALREAVSFPMGPNFMVRSIALNLNSSLSEAKTMMSLYKDAHAHSRTAQKVGPVINKLKMDWLQKFQESLAGLSKDLALPTDIFLSVDEELADFFSEIIKAEQFSQYELTESKFQIIYLGNKTLHKVASFGEDAVRDPLLIMESVYLNRFLC